jgi:hypothetical protein
VAGRRGGVRAGHRGVYHESGTQGLCGFWPYADWLASAEGVRSVLFNQCTYGASQCAAIDEAREWIAATEAAVAWARDHELADDFDLSVDQVKAALAHEFRTAA